MFFNLKMIVKGVWCWFVHLGKQERKIINANKRVICTKCKYVWEEI
jgi:hypothetical protein